jgi:membrane protein YdbS with pleckstrin-like domain
MEQQIFGVSKENFQERKKGYLLALIIIPIAFMIITGIFIHYKPTTSISNKVIIIIFAIFICIVTIVQIIGQKVMLTKLSNRKLIVTDRLICRVGDYKVYINYGDMSKIIIKRNKKGRILSFKIHYFDKKIKLIEFENMDLILEQIKQSVDTQCRIIDKEYLVAWNHPKKVVASILLASIVMLVVVTYTILLIPREFNRSYEGVKFRLGDETEEILEKVRIEFKGTICRNFTLEETFKGSIRINDFAIPSEKNFQGFVTIDLSHGDWLRESISYLGSRIYGNLYMSRDHNQLSIIIMEDNGWNSEDGLMITAPASNRKEALYVSNNVMKLFLGEIAELK